MDDTPIQDQLEEGLAEITGIEEAPDLIGIAKELWLDSNHPAPFDTKPFNGKLIDLFGRNRHDGPNWKTVWGQSEPEFYDGTVRMKYPAAFVNDEELLGYDIHNSNGTVNFVKGTRLPKKLRPGSVVVPRKRKLKIEVGMPFYILERWMAPEEYFVPDEPWKYRTLHEAWDDQNRYEWDGEAGRRIDVMGPLPSRGVYQFVSYIKHQGNPRPPGEDVLDLVRHILRVEEKLKSGYGYQQALSEIREGIVEQKLAEMASFQEQVREAFDVPRVWETPISGYQPLRDEKRRIIRPDEPASAPAGPVVLAGE